MESDTYIYQHSDLRPWDPLNDLEQFEVDFIVGTKTKHKTPMIRFDYLKRFSPKALLKDCVYQIGHRA